LKGVVSDGPFHTADANRGSALNEFLSDDFGRGFGIEEPMPDDLTNDLIGSSIIPFGAPFLRDQALGTELSELFTELKIAAATESVLFGCGLGSEFTFAFEQHRQAACDFIVVRHWQRAGIADESVLLEVEDRHGGSSLARGMKRAFAGGRTVSEASSQRRYKNDEEKAMLRTMDDMSKTSLRSTGVDSAIFD
jgi:hypothetical protein